MNAHRDEPGSAAVDRDHPIVARVLRSWRALTGGRATRDEGREAIVACSGGADSAALAIALATMKVKPLIVHIKHDLRPDAEVEADARSVEGLARSLGCELMVDSVAVRGHAGNTESNARDARYAGLVAIAEQRGIGWVATGHHADDQLETLLMRLIRGTGANGLGGVRASRPLGGCATLVRPMLGITRSQCESLCIDYGYGWSEDSTNADTTLLRNRVRHDVLPVLRAIEPAIAQRASVAARASRSNADALRSMVERCWWDSAERRDSVVVLDRARLRVEAHDAELAELVRISIDNLGNGTGHDSVGHEQIERLSTAVRDGSTEPRRFVLGPIVVLVHAGAVVFELDKERS